MTSTRPADNNADFLKFWAGQTISNLGSSVTFLALPLLIYERTESAVNLSLMAVANVLPVLLFGLPIGAWVDRVDRKRLMIWTDIARALVVATIPALAFLDALPLVWIYGVAFVSSTMTVMFNSAEFAAIPSLVARDDLVEANGQIQASYAAATIAGPILAGVLAGVVSIETVILIDAASFLASAVSLGLIGRAFNTADAAKVTTSIRTDIVEGLRYVLGHPVLRNISLMMAVFNFVGAPVMDQLVLFADQQLGAGESGVGMLFSAAGAGVVVLSLLAGRMRRRWSFSTVALGALLVHGALQVAFGLNTTFVLALPLMAVLMGVAIVFNINTGSLRQSIVPSHLLGRVMSIASVLATSVTPLGSILGGIAIEWTGNVGAVYTGIGIVMMIIACSFRFTALGQAERYLPGGDLAQTQDAAASVLSPVQAEAAR